MADIIENLSAMVVFGGRSSAFFSRFLNLVNIISICVIECDFFSLKNSYSVDVMRIRHTYWKKWSSIHRKLERSSENLWLQFSVETNLLTIFQRNYYIFNKTFINWYESNCWYLKQNKNEIILWCSKSEHL